MKFYAVGWVMISPVDAGLKLLIDNNPALELRGFVFMSAGVPTLEGLPVYSFATAPVEEGAVYVDFSLSAEHSRLAREWAARVGVRLYDMNEWNALLANFARTTPLLLGNGVTLGEMAAVSVEPALLAMLRPEACLRMQKLMRDYRHCDLRAMHRYEEIPNEGFYQRYLRQSVASLDCGNVDVHVNGLDPVIIDICKVWLTVREVGQLSIFRDGQLAYAITGRSKQAGRASFTFTTAARFKDAMAAAVTAADADDNFILVKLQRGLLDAADVLSILERDNARSSDIQFWQISSRLDDAYLGARICRIGTQ